MAYQNPGGEASAIVAVTPRSLPITLTVVIAYLSAIFLFFVGLIYGATGIAGFVLGSLNGNLVMLVSIGSAVVLVSIAAGYRKMERWALYLATAYFVLAIYDAGKVLFTTHGIDNGSILLDIAIPAIILIIGWLYGKRMTANSTGSGTQLSIGVIALVVVAIAQIWLLVSPATSFPLSQTIQSIQSNASATIATSTTGWQTYSHTADPTNPLDVNFSFQYPAGFIQKTVIESGLPFVLVTNPSNLTEGIQVLVEHDSNSEATLHDPSSTSFTTNNGLVGREDQGLISFNTGKQNSNSNAVLLQFSPTLIGQTSTVESIAKTLVLTLP